MLQGPHASPPEGKGALGARDILAANPTRRNKVTYEMCPPELMFINFPTKNTAKFPWHRYLRNVPQNVVSRCFLYLDVHLKTNTIYN